MIPDSEIRVRVTRADIERAYEEIEDSAVEIERECAVAQALMRLGYLGVEVTDAEHIYIGADRYAAIDERPGGERLSRLISDFDADIEDADSRAESDEFVLRRVKP